MDIDLDRMEIWANGTEEWLPVQLSVLCELDPDAVLYRASFLMVPSGNNFPDWISIIIYSNGLMAEADWQCDQPTTADEVAEATWYIYGLPTIMCDGLPHTVFA